MKKGTTKRQFAKKTAAFLLAAAVLMPAAFAGAFGYEYIPETPENEIAKLEAEIAAIEAKIALGEPELAPAIDRYLNDGSGEGDLGDGTGEGDGGIELPEEPVIQIWNGSAADGFDSGSGTVSDPYIIKTAEQLAYFANTVNAGVTYNDKHVALANDIYLNDTSRWQGWHDGGSVYPEFDGSLNNWNPIGYYISTTSNAFFRGDFDGRDYTIHGMYVNTTADYTGLFGYIYDGTVRNVNLSEFLICGANYIGGIAGRNVSGYMIRTSSAGYIYGVDYLGGVAGYMGEGTVSVCASNSRIYGNKYVGGIVGTTGGSVMRSMFAGNIHAQNHAGGIVGWIYATATDSSLVDCYCTGTVYAERCAGGIAGYNHADSGRSCTITNCYSIAQINCPDGAGAISGYNNSEISNCIWINSSEPQTAAVYGSGSVSLCAAYGAEALKSADTYTAHGFNFAGAWSVPAEGEYPYATIKNLPHLVKIDDPLYDIIGSFELSSVDTGASVSLVGNGYDVKVLPLYDAENNVYNFAFENIAVGGGYTVTVTAPGYLPLTITSIFVVNDNIDLSAIGEVVLPCGDINSDGYVDSMDISLLSYDLSKTPEDAKEPLTDLNGDGYRDALDISILAYYLLSTPTDIDFSQIYAGAE